MRKQRRVGDGGVPYRQSAVRSLCSFIAPVACGHAFGLPGWNTETLAQAG